MTLNSAAVAFRILEIVSLLLPLVLILFQITIRNHLEDRVKTLDFSQVAILLSIGSAVVLLVVAGIDAINLLLGKQYSEKLGRSLNFIRLALWVLILPIALFLLSAIFDVYRQSDHENMTDWVRQILSTKPSFSESQTDTDEQNEGS